MKRRLFLACIIFLTSILASCTASGTIDETYGEIIQNQYIENANTYNSSLGDLTTEFIKSTASASNDFEEDVIDVRQLFGTNIDNAINALEMEPNDKSVVKSAIFEYLDAKIDGLTKIAIAMKPLTNLSEDEANSIAILEDVKSATAMLKQYKLAIQSQKEKLDGLQEKYSDLIPSSDYFIRLVADGDNTIDFARGLINRD